MSHSVMVILSNPRKGAPSSNIVRMMMEIDDTRKEVIDNNKEIRLRSCDFQTITAKRLLYE